MFLQTELRLDACSTDRTTPNSRRTASRTPGQLLKWVGNKQRFAEHIIAFFPERFGKYYEPFLGSGAVLAALSPAEAEASDVFRPLVEIWETLVRNPDMLTQWYEDRWNYYHQGDHVERYERMKQSYNRKPNGADLLFLSRSCYGGIVRFRKADGHMSTPCGPHRPISPQSFKQRVTAWSHRIKGTNFLCQDYQVAFEKAQKGDLVYCDPPYVDSQAILYGAQSFKFRELIDCIAAAKARGVFIALSIDGTKRSGDHKVKIEWPDELFSREVSVNVGRSMLKRLQMSGQTLENELVTDRLLLTY